MHDIDFSYLQDFDQPVKNVPYKTCAACNLSQKATAFETEETDVCRSCI